MSGGPATLWPDPPERNNSESFGGRHNHTSDEKLARYPQLGAAVSIIVTPAFLRPLLENADFRGLTAECSVCG